MNSTRKIALMYAGVLVFFAIVLAATSEAASPLNVESHTFYNAYVLQEACFRGSKPNTEAARTEIVMCTAYISGSIDTLYASFAMGGKGCPISVTMDEMMEALAFIFSRVPDSELKDTPASVAVMVAIASTKAGGLCFGGRSFGDGGIAL